MKRLIIRKNDPAIICGRRLAICDFCHEETICAQSAWDNIRVSRPRYRFIGDVYDCVNTSLVWPAFGKGYKKVDEGAEPIAAYVKEDRTDEKIFGIDICKTCAAQIAKQL